METLRISVPMDNRPLVDTAHLKDAIESALDELANEAASDFGKTMQTWQTHKSPVSIEKTVGKRVVSVENQIYVYLNDGTSVRRALLTPDWHSKTAPGVIGSSAGQGLVITVNKKFNFPGIKAREWDKAIVQRIVRDVLPRVSDKLAGAIIKVS